MGRRPEVKPWNREDGLTFPQTRKAVMERDGFRCQICGKQAYKRKRYDGRLAPLGRLRDGNPFYLQLDHIFPRAKGGGNSVANLQALCHGCNSRKGDSS